MATLALTSLVVVAACDDVTRPPSLGSVQVNTLTTGADPDADGYNVGIDGDPTRPLASNGSITLDGVRPGTRLVRLDGVATNCTTGDGVSRQVMVAAGQTTAVAFTVSCVERVGRVVVRVSTTGVELPVSDYRLEIDNGDRQQPIATNDTTTLTGVGEGQHVVWLRALPDNCTSGGANARVVTVAYGQTSMAVFDVVCGATHGVLRITTATTGPDPDPDGYTARVTRGSSTISETAIPVAGTVQVELPVGTNYVVQLLGVAPNCTVEGDTVLTARIDGRFAYEISFAVTCEAGPVRRLPPGTQLAFVRGGRIYRVSSDGSELVQLTDGQTDNQPAWSPDGRRIAFVRKSGSKDEWGRELQDIYVMNADGSNLIRRTSGGLNSDPTWSPDGARIAFAALVLDSSTNIYEGGSNIYVMSADDDGKGAAPVVNGAGWEVQPAWSPDGTTIAFARDDSGDETAADIFVTTLDGSRVTKLTNATWGVGPLYFQPAWSPDGRKLATVVCQVEYTTCASSTIAVMNADGSGLVTLTSTRGLPRPTWSPDGRTIAFTRPGYIGWIRADGSERGIIVADGYSPAWRP